jgi:hypothetical protein
MKQCFFVSLIIILTAQANPAASAGQSNWYTDSFFLLHEDHHTKPDANVGADANPQLTEQLINLSRPDSIQIHAKGRPGWTTYPSKIGHVPPKLACDVLGLWRDIARRNDYHWSIYYNIGRDAEIMKRRPEWNRSKQDGSEWEHALCYHSGVAEEYIWPMLREIMVNYNPDGFWFDGSVFTINLCYCPSCQKRFKSQTGLDDLPKSQDEPGWAEFHEMQRQIYREFIHKTCKLIHSINPECLVTFNLAYAFRMPEKPDPGIAYLTVDIANKVEKLAIEAHWFDGVGLPFELMTTGHVAYKQTQPNKKAKSKKVAKSKHQIQQEMAITIANGGRFNLWDTPTSTSGINPNLHRFYGEVVGPFLRSRQKWSLGSKRLPDVSLLHSAAAHHANTGNDTKSFRNPNLRIDSAANMLARLHLNYEIPGDWRLYDQDIRSPLLIVEDPKKLTRNDVNALIQFISSGGNALVTGAGLQHDQRLPKVFGLTKIAPAQEPEVLVLTINGRKYSFQQNFFKVKTGRAKTILTVTDTAGKTWPFLTAYGHGRGTAYYIPAPLFHTNNDQLSSLELLRDVMAIVSPPEKRLLTTEAPEHVEVVLRLQDNQYVLHMVNMAKGQRTYYPPRRKRQRPVPFIHSLPAVEAHKASIRLPRKPKKITVQPADIVLKDWRYVDGRVELVVPKFEVHQMIVLQLDD